MKDSKKRTDRKSQGLRSRLNDPAADSLYSSGEDGLKEPDTSNGQQNDSGKNAPHVVDMSWAAEYLDDDWEKKYTGKGNYDTRAASKNAEKSEEDTSDAPVSEGSSIDLLSATQEFKAVDAEDSVQEESFKIRDAVTDKTIVNLEESEQVRSAAASAQQDQEEQSLKIRDAVTDKTIVSMTQVIDIRAAAEEAGDLQDPEDQIKIRDAVTDKTIVSPVQAQNVRRAASDAFRAADAPEQEVRLEDSQVLSGIRDSLAAGQITGSEGQSGISVFRPTRQYFHKPRQNVTQPAPEAEQTPAPEVQNEPAANMPDEAVQVQTDAPAEAVSPEIDEVKAPEVSGEQTSADSALLPSEETPKAEKNSPFKSMFRKKGSKKQPEASDSEDKKSSESKPKKTSSGKKKKKASAQKAEPAGTSDGFDPEKDLADIIEQKPSGNSQESSGMNPDLEAFISGEPSPEDYISREPSPEDFISREPEPEDFISAEPSPEEFIESGKPDGQSRRESSKNRQPDRALRRDAYYDEDFDDSEGYETVLDDDDPLPDYDSRGRKIVYEYEDVKSPLRFIPFVLVVALCVLGFITARQICYDTPYNANDYSKVSYTVEAGLTDAKLGEDLLEMGLIENTLIFRLRCIFYDADYVEGTYELSPCYSTEKIINILSGYKYGTDE